jgi:hypothetical protein
MKRPGQFDFIALLFCLAVLAFALRAILIWQYPQAYGDADIYLTVAENIVQNGCVSISEPSDGACQPHWGGNQLPGFPAFIALNFALFDHSLTAVRLVQTTLAVLAILYLCAALRFLTKSFSAVACAGLLLALSPLAIGWPRHIFTETLALALTTWLFAELAWSLAENRLRSLRLGLVLALAAFVRIDLLSLCLPIAACAFLIHSPGQALRKGLIVLIGLALPLAGWSLRSVSQGLPALPPMAVMADGSPLPAGIMTWGGTWSSKEYHLNLWAFPVFTKSYSAVAPPPQAYANAAEKGRVEALLAELSRFEGKAFPTHIDDGFAQIAMEKKAARPLFHWLYLPLRRAFEMWFNPFTSAGLPGAAELPGAISSDAIKRAVTEGISGITHLILQYPELTLFKAASIGYRIVLVFGVLSIMLFAARGALPAVRPLLIMGLLFAIGRTGAFALTFNTTTRYIVEAAIPLEITCGVFLGLWWSRHQAAKQMKSGTDAAS